MNYTIVEHKHKFCSWTASRAANVKGCRFSVKLGRALLESISFQEFLNDPDLLPEPEQVDEWHRHLRVELISEAELKDVSMTHGVAAKLMNTYLKGGLVCGGHETHRSVGALHPPIDRLLLDSLIKNNIGGLRHIWRFARNTGWSKLDSVGYETLICNLKEIMGKEPLWKVEKYWRGFQ